MAEHTGARAGGSDSSGYLNDAKLLTALSFHVPQRTIEGLAPSSLPYMSYIPLGFLPYGSAEMTPTYPMGLPILIAAASKIFGASMGPHVTLWVQAMACLLLTFMLARAAGLGEGWSWVACLALATSPLFIFMSLQAMSDMPALLWVTASVVAAIFSRRSFLSAFIAGFALAFAVLIRPTNILGILPVAFAIGFDWRRWLRFGIGAAPGALVFCALNQALYGHAITTGYGNVSGDFGPQYAWPTMINYLHWLPVELSPLAALAVALPIVLREKAGFILPVLGSWILSFFAFYLFYRYTQQAWWYLRFVLPAFPALIVSALLVADRLLRNGSKSALWAAGILASFLVLGWNIAWTSRLGAQNIGDGEKVYLETSLWVHDHLPANCVLVAMQESGALFYYTKHPVLRWDSMNPQVFGKVELACARAGIPIYMVLFPYETATALKISPDRHWTRLGAVRFVQIWKLSD
jgi:hypothetical protein